MNERLRIPNLTIAKLLMAGVIVLVLAHCASQLALGRTDNRYTQQLVEWFGLDREGNFPTFYSSLLLILVAAQFALIALLRRTPTANGAGSFLAWASLGGIFVFLALDEAVQIHEMFDNNSMLSFMQTSGLLAWPWVIVYSTLVLCFAAIYMRFWLSQPAGYRARCAACAVLYVVAAIGFEMLGAAVYTAENSNRQLYLVLYTLEELLEMSALVLLIYCNNRYLSEHMPSPLLVFSE